MIARSILAIETSSRTGSVALGVDGAVAERTIATPREQTPQILALIDALLAEAGIRLADLDALVFGRGPGSFTGLRVAAAVVQGLSLGSGVPIVPVSSLAALAQRGLGPANSVGAASLAGGAGHVGAAGEASAVWSRPTRALCCLDARMGELYWARFGLAGGLAVAETEERIGRPADVTAPEAGFLALGNAFAAHGTALEAVLARAAGVDADLEPRAPELLTLAAPDVEAGRFVAAAAALPVYLREADAWSTR
jgi:tRNA threonylcarbamoyladenosine biosynthesis protein TsaB